MSGTVERTFQEAHRIALSAINFSWALPQSFVHRLGRPRIVSQPFSGVEETRLLYFIQLLLSNVSRASLLPQFCIHEETPLGFHHDHPVELCWGLCGHACAWICLLSVCSSTSGTLSLSLSLSGSRGPMCAILSTHVCRCGVRGIQYYDSWITISEVLMHTLLLIL